jgi:hypothetical protein
MYDEDQNRAARKIVKSHFKVVFFSKQVITITDSKVHNQIKIPKGEKKRNTHKAKQSNFFGGESNEDREDRRG